MFLGYEHALKQHLAGAVPNAPVYGSFDEPDLIDSPVFVQVVWLGYSVTDQSASRTAANLSQQFAVRIGLDALRADSRQIEKAANALTAVLDRVLGFTYTGLHGARIKPQLSNPPAPAYSGAAAEMAVYFTLQGVAVATPDQE
jgi:hypothetical protein